MEYTYHLNPIDLEQQCFIQIKRLDNKIEQIEQYESWAALCELKHLRRHLVLLKRQLRNKLRKMMKLQEPQERQLDFFRTDGSNTPSHTTFRCYEY